MNFKYDKDKAIQAIREYVYFCEDNVPKPYETDDSVVKKFDAKRKEKHLAIGAVFGLSETTYPDVKQVIGFGSWSWEWKHWLADNLIDDYCDWKFYQIVDEINNFKAIYNGVETDYKRKPRIKYIIETLEEKVANRMAPINAVMDEYRDNLKAWNADHHDKDNKKKYLYDHSNRHDYNGSMSSIQNSIAIIKSFSEQPMEAYLKVATKTFIDGPYEAVMSCLNKLDAIAFRAQEMYKKEPFYKYLEKKGEKKND